MSNKGTVSDTYVNLIQVIEFLEKQQADINLVETVKTAQKYLLSLELLAIASANDTKE